MADVYQNGARLQLCGLLGGGCSESGRGLATMTVRFLGGLAGFQELHRP